LFYESERGNGSVFETGGLLWEIMTLARESGRKEDDQWQSPWKFSEETALSPDHLSMNRLLDTSAGRCFTEYSYELPRSMLHLLQSKRGCNGGVENVFSVSMLSVVGDDEVHEPFYSENIIVRSLDSMRCPNASLRVLEIDMIFCERDDVQQPNVFFIPKKYEGWPCVMFGHHIKCGRPLIERSSDQFLKGHGALWDEAVTGFKYLREMAGIMRRLPLVGEHFNEHMWFTEAGNRQLPGMNPGGGCACLMFSWQHGIRAS
jgi:hypothetical protein